MNRLNGLKRLTMIAAAAAMMMAALPAQADDYVFTYDGGYLAAYTKSGQNYPVVNVKAGLVSHNVYGGGKGNLAVVTGNPQVTLSGTAQVGGNVYGGGDAARVDGDTKVTLRD